MYIRAVPIDQINAATFNPRVDLQPGEPEYEKLNRSIEEFGYVEPIVWNERTGNMVGGHQRYKILVNEHGHTELQVSVVDLDDQQERLPNIALNKVSGRWDDEALGRLFEELQEDQEEFEDLIAEFGTIPDTVIEDPVVEDDFDARCFG
ncbi:ParB N-terminal domain-containing protein [Paenibacillus pabuli]|uniref:ParB N-terminal domain-containing protein n=1 Tax=Paenibacillus pabuli TaxID=1472 RepID=UPI0034588081